MPKHPIGPSNPDPIGTACAVRGASQFSNALGVVVDRFRHVPAEKLPHDLRMLEVLSMFLPNIELWGKERSAMKHFLADREHKLARFAAEAASFCEAIGAPHTAKFFARTFALFPGGALPKSQKDIFLALARVSSGKPNPIAAIEREHADSFKELTGALQRWLREHQREVEQAVAETVDGKSKSVRAGGAKKSSSKRSEPTALDAILSAAAEAGADVDYELLYDLDEWVWSTPGRKAIPFADIPDGAKLIDQMESLSRALGTGGVRYVADWEGLADDFVSLRQYAETIKARKTLALLDEFAALFPRKRVPKDRDERSDAFERREERDAKRGKNPVDAIDEKYAEAAANEIPKRVLDYVHRNKQRFEAESASAAAQPAGSSPGDLLLDKSDWIAFFHEMVERFGPGVRLDELPDAERAAVGDVMQVKAGRRFAYLQVTHLHPMWGLRGPVMRAIAGTSAQALTGDALAAHVAGPTAFITLVTIDRARAEKHAKLVARGVPVPAEYSDFPRFLFHWGKTRDGRNVWGEWDGDMIAIAQHVGPLPAPMLSMPMANSALGYESIGEAIRDGWTHPDGYVGWGEKVGSD